MFIVFNKLLNLKGRDVVKRAFIFVFIKFWIHFRASTVLTHQRFYPREYFKNLKVENVGSNFLFSQNYFHRYIVTNVPVHANATLPPVKDLVSVSTFLSELYVHSWINKVFSYNDHKVCLPPVPDVCSLVLRLHLHDPGRHRGEVHRRVSASPVQVSILHSENFRCVLVSSIILWEVLLIIIVFLVTDRHG